MASRSTRNKVRWQAQKAIDHAEKILEHLKYLDELAEDRSDYICVALPVVVVGVTRLKESLEVFKDGL